MLLWLSIVIDDGYVCGKEWRRFALRVNGMFRAKARSLVDKNPDGINIVAIGGGDISAIAWNSNMSFDWESVAAFFYPFSPSSSVPMDGSIAPPRYQPKLQTIRAGSDVPKALASRRLPRTDEPEPTFSISSIAGVLFSTASLSSGPNPRVYWIENLFCTNAIWMRPAFAAIHQILVHRTSKEIEYLPAEPDARAACN